MRAGAVKGSDDRDARRCASLRQRLLLGLVSVIVIGWTVALSIQYRETTREHTGRWDQGLLNVGQQILLSLPPLDGVSNAMTPSFSLPERVRGTGGPLQDFVYQAWHHDGRMLLRSSGAPAAPLLPLDFSPADRFGEARFGDETWRVYAISDAGGQVQVQIGKSRRHFRDELTRWLWDSLRIAALIGTLVIAITWWIVDRALIPATRLQQSIAARPPLDVEAIDSKDLPRELQPLVDAFNDLLKRLGAALLLERRFLADAAHELRTPLAALRAQAQAAAAATSLDESRAALVPLIEGIDRATRLSEQMLELAHVDALDGRQGGPQPIHELAALVVQDFAAMARARGQHLAIRTEACEAMVEVDALGVMLRNLIDNAVRHAGPGARIEVGCRVDPAAGEVVLSVLDDGPGVALAERERIFDRFYRASGTRSSGSGIGLSLVARIARFHGAGIEVGEGLAGRGFGIRVRLPAGAQDPGQSGDQRPPGRGRTQREPGLARVGP